MPGLWFQLPLHSAAGGAILKRSPYSETYIGHLTSRVCGVNDWVQVILLRFEDD